MSDTVKPGIKTTEFWVNLIVPFIVAVLAGVADMFGFQLPTEAIYGVIATGVTYILARGWTKSSESKAQAEMAKAESLRLEMESVASLPELPASN